MSQPHDNGSTQPQHQPDRVKPNTKAKSRSRNGCPHCKSRRLKCDETKPECLMCVKNNRKCPGYAQSFKWSTKHEKSLTGKARGPANLKDLVTATSKTISGDDVSKQTQAADAHDEQKSTTFESPPTGQLGSDGSENLLGDTDSSVSPMLDNLILPEYNYGIEDLLQDIWQDVPQPDTFAPPDNSKDAYQYVDQSLCLFNSPGDTSSFLPWQGAQPFSPQYQPIFSQIPRTITDRSSLLVEEWFRNVCSMWSSFDSEANLNRKLAYETWTRSEAVMNCLQSMSATCLSSQMPAMKQIAVSYLRSAIAAIQRDLKAAHDQPAGTFPIGLLLSLCCIGTAACWIDTKEIGSHFLREAKKVLKRVNRDSKNLSAQDRQILSFFNNSIIYWNMLVAVVSDEKDDLGIPKLKEPQNKELTRPIVPHPWTGVSANSQRLFTQAVRLCRRFRRNLRQGSIATMRNLETALRDIKEAQEIEEELLGLEHYQAHEISETGDRMSPASHFIDVAEGYRLASLVQLYQTFPDLVARRLPEDATGSAGFVPWDNWIVPLSLRLVNTLRKVPVHSGTRCIQPLLYLSASTGLRFDAETLVNQQRARVPPRAASIDSSGNTRTMEPVMPPPVDGTVIDEPQLTITRLSIEVTHARRFVMERLSALEHSLPPAPVLVAKDLVKAIWNGYDNDSPGSNYTHWIDVMEDSDLRTIFVSFRTLDGLTLRAHIYPSNEADPGPGIILLPGFSFVKETLVPRVAEHFQSAGITALAYDPRTLGESDGMPRCDIDPPKHVADFHDALTFLSEHPKVDPARIAYWGFSFNGIVALNAAALDRRAKCVIAISPLMDLSYPERDLQNMLADAMKDRAAQLAGQAPRYVPVVQKNGTCPYGWGAGTSLKEYLVAERIAALVPTYKNETTLQSHYRISTWRPYELLPLIEPTPVLIVTAMQDYMSPPEKQKALYDGLKGPKEYLLVPNKGHMDLLGGSGFEALMAKQVDFLARHLGTQDPLIPPLNTMIFGEDTSGYRLGSSVAQREIQPKDSEAFLSPNLPPLAVISLFRAHREMEGTYLFFNSLFGQMHDEPWRADRYSITPSDSIPFKVVLLKRYVLQTDGTRKHLWSTAITGHRPSRSQGTDWLVYEGP
ncbi:putative Fungal-specific transcription factor domain-containing protein [Seiridium cardinale]